MDIEGTIGSKTKDTCHLLPLPRRHVLHTSNGGGGGTLKASSSRDPGWKASRAEGGGGISDGHGGAGDSGDHGGAGDSGGHGRSASEAAAPAPASTIGALLKVGLREPCPYFFDFKVRTI